MAGRGTVKKCQREVEGGRYNIFICTCSIQVTVVMDRACTDEDVGRAVERMWQRRFAAHGPHPSRHR